MIIKVRHHLQMGHRLWMPRGKCNNLHGHTWKVLLTVEGEQDRSGMLLEYGALKTAWRTWLDEEFDHRMVLDSHDPLLEHLGYGRSDQYEPIYPGLKTVNFNPTVENLSKYFAANASAIFPPGFNYGVELWEGDNNAAIATQ